MFLSLFLESKLLFRLNSNGGEHGRANGWIAIEIDEETKHAAATGKKLINGQESRTFFPANWTIFSPLTVEVSTAKYGLYRRWRRDSLNTSGLCPRILLDALISGTFVYPSAIPLSNICVIQIYFESSGRRCLYDIIHASNLCHFRCTLIVISTAPSFPTEYLELFHSRLINIFI